MVTVSERISECMNALHNVYKLFSELLSSMFFTVYDLQASFVGKSFCSWSRTRLVTTKLSSERFGTFSSEGRRKRKWGKNKREQKEQELSHVPEKKGGSRV